MIAAIVLAAGEASRFGQCKQLVRLGDKTLLEHVLQTVRETTIDDIVVVLGAHAEEIQNAVAFDRERVVMNPLYANGMSTSIHAGLRTLDGRAEAAVMVLADQPFIAPRTIDAIVSEYRRSGASIVIPTYRGARGNPVLVARKLFPDVMSIRGDTGLRSIFQRHASDILRVEVDDVGVVTDIDTQADLGDVTGRSR